jgi:hypothetical protein
VSLVKSIEADVQSFVRTLREAATDVKGIVVRAAPKVDAILDEVAQAAKSVRASADGFQGIGPKVSAIVAEAGLDLDEALGKFAQTAHNLADASEDLAANPWKIATKPDEKEIAYENLRAASRNYVRAAEQVAKTVARLQALNARADLSSPELQVQARRVAESLKADQARFDESARLYMSLLQAGGGPPAKQR